MIGRLCRAASGSSVGARAGFAALALRSAIYFPTTHDPHSVRVSPQRVVIARVSYTRRVVTPRLPIGIARSPCRANLRSVVKKSCLRTRRIRAPPRGMRAVIYFQATRDLQRTLSASTVPRRCARRCAHPVRARERRSRNAATLPRRGRAQTRPLRLTDRMRSCSDHLVAFGHLLPPQKIR